MRRFVPAMLLIGSLVVAAVMLWLGLWQMQVFQSHEERDALARTQQPPVALIDVAPADAPLGDAYGRTITASGTWLQDLMTPVRYRGDTRWLAPLQLADGRVLPVVVGRGQRGDTLPAGPQSVQGVFLASEAAADGAAPGELASVRLQLVAQRWPHTLVPGFINLPPEAAESLGLEAAPVRLPSGEGSFRNIGYALQWWVFAAFAVAGGVVLSRSARRNSLSDKEKHGD